MTDAVPAPLVVVQIKPAWQSKVSWTAVLAALVSLVTTIALGFEPETQVKILAVTQLVNSVATVVLKTWFTNTVAPQSMPAAPPSIG